MWHAIVIGNLRIVGVYPCVRIVQELLAEGITHNLIELVIADGSLKLLLGAAYKLLIFLLADDVVERGIALFYGRYEEIKILVGLLNGSVFGITSGAIFLKVVFSPKGVIGSTCLPSLPDTLMLICG